MAMQRMPPNKHNIPSCNDNCNGKREMKNRNQVTWHFCQCRCHSRTR